MKCPECKKPMKWKEGLLSESGHRDMSIGRYYCPNCKLCKTPEESKGIRKGRTMAHSLVGVRVMDKQITKQRCAIQIGILRERQHCKTCGKPHYSSNKTIPCLCTDCDCLYCSTVKK